MPIFDGRGFAPVCAVKTYQNSFYERHIHQGEPSRLCYSTTISIHDGLKVPLAERI